MSIEKGSGLESSDTGAALAKRLDAVVQWIRNDADQMLEFNQAVVKFDRVLQDQFGFDVVWEIPAWHVMKLSSYSDRGADKVEVSPTDLEVINRMFDAFVRGIEERFGE